MPHNARVRVAALHDLEQIAPLFRESLTSIVSGNEADISSLYEPWLISEHVRRHCFPSDADSNAVQTYVVEEFTPDSNILGFAVIKTHGMPSGGTERSHELKHLVVPSQLRSRGVGSLLMSYLQSQYWEHGLWVRVVKRCERASRFYDRWRFTFVKEVQASDIGEAVLIMLWPGKQEEDNQ